MTECTPTCPPLLQGIERIVFLGDSITQAGHYSTDVECWLLQQGLGLEVLNAGLSSETATDLTPEENAGHLNAHGFARPLISQRLARTLSVTCPDLLIVCYGMNDGDSMFRDNRTVERFSAAVTSLRSQALAAGAKQVVLCTPPIHDPGAGATGADPHEASLADFSNWLVSQRDEGWQVVDIHGAMLAALAARRMGDPAFTFQPDTVHPDRHGHWLMACEILTQLFGADLEGAASAEALFARNGEAIRERVYRRNQLLMSAVLTAVGHSRPGAPGGPGESPGPTLAEARTEAQTLAQEISALLAP